MSRSLGIDIGRDVTAAALVDDDGGVTVLELGDGRVPTESAVLFDDDGSTTVGDLIKAQMDQNRSDDDTSSDDDAEAEQ